MGTEDDISPASLAVYQVAVGRGSERTDVCRTEVTELRELQKDLLRTAYDKWGPSYVCRRFDANEDNNYLRGGPISIVAANE